MLTHLAVLPRQVTATGADRIWPPGTCLQADCLGLCDLCVSDKASSLAKKILKMGQSKIELYLVSPNAEPLLIRLMTSSLSNPRPTSPWDSEEVYSTYLAHSTNY